MKRILFIIAILIGLAGNNIIAQKEISYPEINEKSYDFYLKGDWKNLIKTGKDAEKADINFYYLKIRMGIAYYNLKKYRQAVPYLESALAESPADEFVLEYLYYAYLFSGQASESRKLTSGLSPEMKEKLKIKTKTGFSGIEVETKFDTWDDYKIEGSSTDTIQQSVIQDYNYYGANIDFNLKKNAKFSVGFSRVGVTENDIWLDSDTVLTQIDRKIGQNQLYLSFLARPAKGMSLVIATNLMFLSLDDVYTTIESTSTLKAGFGNGPGSGSGTGFGSGGGGSNSSTSSYNSIIGNNFDFVAHVGLYKNFSLFRAGVFTSFSDLNNNIQLQPGLSFTTYPLGNTNLYTVSTLSYLFEKYDNSSTSKVVFKQALGLNLWGIYVEPAYTYGEMFNYIEGDGYIVNNCNDIPKNRLEVLAYTYLFKGKLNLFFKYQNYDRINYYIINNVTQSINYNYQSFIGGIKWNF